MIKQGTTENLYFTETDNLGSIISLLEEDGSYAKRDSYDACFVRRSNSKAEGRRRNPTDWSYDNVPTPTLVDRGFTGHEHLDEFGLINMNGRVYDTYIGRFLSVDPIIQFTGNSQSFNGYGYCLNNPLSYIDPSGYLFQGLWDWLKRLFGSDECDTPNDRQTNNAVSWNRATRGGGGDVNGYEPSIPALFEYWYLSNSGISVGGGSIGGNITYGGGAANSGSINIQESSSNKEQFNEDRIILLANRLAMKELNFNWKDIVNDIQSYGEGSPLYSKLSKLNNPQKYTKNWTKAYNSSTWHRDALVSPVIWNTGFALKYYPIKEGCKDAIGLDRINWINHYIEMRLELEESIIRKYLNLQDDWLYDMHFINSILFLNNLQ